jgi:hypothetical protein
MLTVHGQKRLNQRLRGPGVLEMPSHPISGDSGVDWGAEGVPNSVMVQMPFANAQVLIAVSTLLNAADISPVQPSPE